MVLLKRRLGANLLLGSDEALVWRRAETSATGEAEHNAGCVFRLLMRPAIVNSSDRTIERVVTEQFDDMAVGFTVSDQFLFAHLQFEFDEDAGAFQDVIAQKAVDSLLQSFLEAIVKEATVLFKTRTAEGLIDQTINRVNEIASCLTNMYQDDYEDSGYSSSLSD